MVAVASFGLAEILAVAAGAGLLVLAGVTVLVALAALYGRKRARR